jgi:hypothetical protein
MIRPNSNVMFSHGQELSTGPSTRRAAATFLGVAAALSALALPSPASAQGVDDFGAYGYDDHSNESPQDASFELRWGPYRPNVDEEFGGSGPFARHFGEENHYLLGFEGDWQIFRIPHVGSLGPGVGWGLVSMDGQTFRSNGDAADQTTGLSIMPMYAVGVLRVDVLAQQTPVPLAFHAKFGLGYALWWTDDGVGLSRDASGVTGEGASYGYQGALGLLLLLDAFDTLAARDLDSTFGVNNSYLFLEAYHSNLDGFGSGDQMQMGTTTWMLGLALEM